MTRKLSISAVALLVGLASAFAVPAHTKVAPAGAHTVVWQALAWQAQQVSRWQVDRFGPIVASDTMWTIASYYGRQAGVSVYEMMDAIVAANPRVFIDNRPDRMMDGYYLVIPAVGKLASTPTEQPQQPDEQVEQLKSTDTVQFKAEELRDLRDRLAGSIGMIEALQSENAALQSRLNDVTAELEALKVQLAEDRAIDQEIDAIAGELATQVPGVEGNQETIEQTGVLQPQQPQTEQPVVEQPVVEQAVVEQPAEPVAKAPTQTAKSSNTQRSTPDFLDWVLQPPQLYVVIAVPVLLLLILMYMAYVRRIKREFEQQTEAPEDSADSPADDGIDAGTDDVNDESKADDSAEPHQPSSRSSEDADSIDANAVVTGLAAVTGAAVVVDTMASEQEYELDNGNDETLATADTNANDVAINSDYNDDELAAMFGELDANSGDEQSAEAATDDTIGAEQEFDLSEFEVSSDDPLLAADDEFYLGDDDITGNESEAGTEAAIESSDAAVTGLEDDDDFARLLASLEAPADGDSRVEDERQPPVAKREPKLADDSLSSWSLADENIEQSDGYVSIDSLLNEADSAEQTSDDEQPDFDSSSYDESKTPAAMLDLAQAYIDMGELDDARALLKRIIGCDDADADREAALLLQQLDSQSGR
ncbi:FimV/HubP family polar landmark protein [Pseudidiomarina mangrovi]|uniref:FimV/HubP family polar landmark protein n=1 Tax=Pseudidiomarina mangrovi TaxID=2487133 RepID=UPI000FCB9CAA|nr:FimV/HubP family polar landmark protein [Pseudidiomarina mangrovi]